MVATVMKKKIFLLSLSAFLLYTTISSGNPIETQIYKNSIRTVQLYHAINEQKTQRLPAVVPTNRTGLVLEFDDLAEDAAYYKARIIPCNYLWEAATAISDPEILYEYNEFPIDDYEFSFDTKTDFVHFFLKLPRLKRSGNYILFVYEEDNSNTPVFTNRFMVYDKAVQVLPEQKPSGTVAISRINHQINFLVRYPNLNIVNPSQELKVVIRQNQRWDNVQYMEQPTFLREDLQEAEYRYFNYEHGFNAGNQFRFFDLRSVRYAGQNVYKTETKGKTDEAILMMDKSKKGEAYAIFTDINGGYFIQTRDKGGTDLEADYLRVHFMLKGEKINEAVYVFGALTNWKKIPESKMQYNKECACYTAQLFLKQGWYDYQYIVDDPEKQNYFEGDHFETENLYEIFVYYRPQGARNDMLIGYLPMDRY